MYVCLLVAYTRPHPSTGHFIRCMQCIEWLMDRWGLVYVTSIPVLAKLKVKYNSRHEPNTNAYTQGKEVAYHNFHNLQIDESWISL